MIDTTKSIFISLQRHVSTLTGRQQTKIHLCISHIKVHNCSLEFILISPVVYGALQIWVKINIMAL